LAEKTVNGFVKKATPSHAGKLLQSEAGHCITNPKDREVFTKI